MRKFLNWLLTDYKGNKANPFANFVGLLLIAFLLGLIMA